MVLGFGKKLQYPVENSYMLRDNMKIQNEEYYYKLQDSFTLLIGIGFGMFCLQSFSEKKPKANCCQIDIQQQWGSF